MAALGTTDIVATAPGKIIPSGRTKIIQPFETGVVRAIHVQDGQSVKAGDVIIELDPTMSEAELGHLKNDLVTTQLEVARLRAALGGHADPLEDFHAPVGASPMLIEMERQFLISQSTEQNAKLAEIERQRAQKEAERATIAATIAKLNATIPLRQQRVDVRKYLTDKELGSKLQYLTELQDLVGEQQDILVQQSRYRETDAAVAVLAETRAKVQSEYRRTLFDDLAKAEQKAGGLAQDVIKAEERTKLQLLTAPVDGVVQQLAVHTVGGVVTPAQALAVVVPDSHLEIEAMVSNRDISERQRAQKEAERATIAATIAKLNATIPLRQQRVDVRKYLTDKELGSKLQYLTELQDLVGEQQDILVQQSRYRETDAAVAVLAETRAKVQSEYRRTLFDDLAKAEQKAGGLAQPAIRVFQNFSAV